MCFDSNHGHTISVDDWDGTKRAGSGIRGGGGGKIKARDRQFRFQLDSGRGHLPRDMSSSETGHCYSEINTYILQLCGTLLQLEDTFEYNHQFACAAPRKLNRDNMLHKEFRSVSPGSEIFLSLVWGSEHIQKPSREGHVFNIERLLLSWNTTRHRKNCPNYVNRTAVRGSMSMSTKL
eukprot:gene15072-biopygen425